MACTTKLSYTLKLSVQNANQSPRLVWQAVALPTLKTVQPKLKYGAVVLTDNTTKGAKGYADLLGYLRDPENGFRNMTLPFNGGFEMSVYQPKGKQA